MRPITILRAIAWLAAVTAMWSLSSVWGTIEVGVVKGPPPEFEREVALGLVMIGLTALLLTLPSAAGRRRWLLRGFAAATSATAAFIALSVRSKAVSSSFPGLIEGGWVYFAIGAGISLAVAVTALLLPAKKKKVKVGGKKARRKRS